MRNAHFFARGADAEIAAPVQPAGAVGEAPLKPSGSLVEFPDENEQIISFGIDAGGEIDDRPIEFVDFE
jgi:hypothetical protein